MTLFFEWYLILRVHGQSDIDSYQLTSCPSLKILIDRVLQATISVFSPTEKNLNQNRIVIKDLWMLKRTRATKRLYIFTISNFTQMLFQRAARTPRRIYDNIRLRTLTTMDAVRFFFWTFIRFPASPCANPINVTTDNMRQHRLIHEKRGHARL